MKLINLNVIPEANDFISSNLLPRLLNKFDKVHVYKFIERENRSFLSEYILCVLDWCVFVMKCGNGIVINASSGDMSHVSYDHTVNTVCNELSVALMEGMGVEVESADTFYVKPDLNDVYSMLLDSKSDTLLSTLKLQQDLLEAYLRTATLTRLHTLTLFGGSIFNQHVLDDAADFIHNTVSRQNTHQVLF
jgi:hypothetical protein